MTELKKLARHSSIYVLGNAARNLIGFLMLPVYTRFLTPADYGAISLILFTLAVIEPIFGARLVQAIPKYFHDQKDEAGRDSVISTALLVTALVSLGSMLAVLLGRDAISTGIFGSTDYATVVALFSTVLVTQAVEYYSFAHIRLLEKPWLFVSLSLAKLVVQLSLNIWFIVYLKMGVNGAAISSALSGVIFALLMGLYTFSKVGLGFRAPLAWSMIRFCWPLWLSGLAILYISSSSRPFIRIFASLDEVGYFELASKFGSIIAVLLWDPFFLIWQIERFKIGATEEARRTFRAVFRLVGTAMLVIGAGIGIYADVVIAIMADPSFHVAAAAVAPVTFGMVFHCLCNFVNFSFLARESTRSITRITYGSAVVVTLTNLLLIPKWGFVGAGYAILLAQVLRFAWMYAQGQKLYDMGLAMREFWIAFAVTLVASIVASAIPAATLTGMILKDTAVMALCTAAFVAWLWSDASVRGMVTGFFAARAQKRAEAARRPQE